MTLIKKGFEGSVGRRGIRHDQKTLNEVDSAETADLMPRSGLDLGLDGFDELAGRCRADAAKR